MLDPNFVEFLNKSEVALAHLVAVAIEWYKLQGKDISLGGEATDGPQEWKEDGVVAHTTIPISANDLDALTKGMAEAVVKERAMAFVKGFLLGVSVVV